MKKTILILSLSLLSLIAKAQQSTYYGIVANKDTAQAGDTIKLVATDAYYNLQLNCPNSLVAIGFESYQNQNLYTIAHGVWSQMEVNDSIIVYWTVPSGTGVGLGQFYFNSGGTVCGTPITSKYCNTYIKAGTASGIEKYNANRKLKTTEYFNTLGEQVNTIEANILYVRKNTYTDNSISTDKIIFQ